MKQKQQKYHFYKCSVPEFAPGHNYFDHSNGIAGYKRKQKRDRYLGHMTIDEISKETTSHKHNIGSRGNIGRRTGYTNASRGYDSRH